VVDATSNVAREFGATKTPEAYLFDSNGNLVYQGAIDDNANNPAQVSETYLKDALEAVVQGVQVQTKQTR
ncbi:MAG: thioredoxin family protein, partial [Gammaproteobacteria bacterium]|nr:thioredoxin family protein [Gammaproteobacteria bacterium]NIR95327.1 thioredoxin family protein [Gammaproteobacteria bacterium]NIW45526.1 thioredoxin family protein [Gammaproteobacteria bacterium]NIW98069.1 thioredoxin family protein [Phycisphaerae bacterium]